MNNDMDITEFSKFLCNFDDYRAATIIAKFHLSNHVDAEGYSENETSEYIEDLCNRASFMYQEKPTKINLFCLTMAVSTLKHLRTSEVDSEYSLFLLANRIKQHKYVPTPMERFKQWTQYCDAWDNMAKNSSNISPFPVGIELSPDEYQYYKNHGYPLQEISAWCKSGENAHNFMQHVIPAPGYSAEAYEKDWDGEFYELGKYTPRAGFYKVIKKNDDKWLQCFYTRSRDLHFIDELVTIDISSLYNKWSSRGPIGVSISEGDIIHIKRTSIIKYFFPSQENKESNGITYAYRVEWNKIKNNHIPSIYPNVVKHADTTNPIISMLIKKEYVDVLYDCTLEKYCFVYNDLKTTRVNKKQLDDLVFKFNYEQLETLQSYLCSCVTRRVEVNHNTMEIIQDICNKSPIIVPVAKCTPIGTCTFDYEPLKLYTTFGKKILFNVHNETLFVEFNAPYFEYIYGGRLINEVKIEM